MAKNGAYSAAGGGHGLEGGPTWGSDQKANKGKSKAAGIKWSREASARPRKKVGDPDDPDPDDRPEGDLRSNESLLELFRSDISALRTHPFDNWGYRIVRPLTAADGAGPGVLPDAESRRPGRPRLRDSVSILRDLALGEPAIDHGAAALVGFAPGDMTINPVKITQEMEKAHPYVRTLALASQILGTYDFPEEHLVRRKIKKKKPRKSRAKAAEDEGESFHSVPCKVDEIEEYEELLKIVITERSRLAKGVKSNLHRKTVDVSPALSRAIQIMIEQGRVKEARKILDDLVIPLSKRFELIFPGSKVVCVGWHVKSGQLHLDLWVHSTRLETVLTGLKKKAETARLWDKYSLCHFGNGPGICALNRHVAALGDEAADLCPGIVDEVREAIARAEERGAEREARGRGAGLANRDIAIHEAFDEIVSAALPNEYVAQGMEVYRRYLRDFYLAGGDQKMKPEHEAEMEVSIAARLAKAKKAQEDAELARNTAQEAIMAAATALERAEAEARKLAEPILAAARKAEAALPAMERDAELRGFRLAYSKICPVSQATAKTVDEAKKLLDSGVAGIRHEAEIGAWAKVWKFLGIGEIQPGASVKTLEEGTESAIAGRLASSLAAGLAGIFRVFGREAPEVQTPDAVEKAMMDAGEAYKENARLEGLVFAVSKIRGVEVSGVEGMDEGALTADIVSKAGEFRASEQAREKAAVEGFAVAIYGRSIASFLIESAKKSVVEMKKVLAAEFKRRGKAESLLERVLPLLEKHDPTNAEEARNLIAARPKIPNISTKVAKKAAKGKADGGDGLPDL
jgi:hypothetical protein